MSLLKAYFRRRLNRLLFSVLFFIIILISTQFLFEIFHDLTFYEIGLSDIAFFYMKELIVTAPIIINISFILSWVLLQNQRALSHQQHASLMSGWGHQQDTNFAISNLCQLSLVNFLLLFYISPLMELSHLRVDSQELDWLAHKDIPKALSLQISDRALLSFESVSHGVINKPVLIEGSTEGWHYIAAEQGLLEQSQMVLRHGQIKRHPLGDGAPITISFEKATTRLEQKPLKPHWQGLDGKTLLETRLPRGKAELFWRFFLIFQPWICLLPFFSQKVALRQTVSMQHSLIEVILLFSFSITWAFHTCKVLNFKPWHECHLEGLFLVLFIIYGKIRGWQRGSYA